MIFQTIYLIVFYKEELGAGNETKFIKKVRERHPDLKIKEIQDYIKNQEVSQINTSVNKTYQYKITAQDFRFDFARLPHCKA